MSKEKAQVVFLPLGGTGEIGMNCNLYGVVNGKNYDWLMVDLGVTFGRGEEPGIDLIMPDLSFIEARRERLRGLLLTHAHEDHIGAVAHLWKRLQCPIYATPFTAAIVRGKLAEAGLDNVPLHIIDVDAHVSLPPFDIDFISLTHSIPEPSALAIRCRLPDGKIARILHTGDWKIDPDPVIGVECQEQRIRDFANEDTGVDAIICDSTNVLVSGRAGSEGAVAAQLRETIAGCANRVVVTGFASNIARMASVAAAAHACGREICLAGRGMHKAVAAAKATGYLQDMPLLVNEEDAAYLPREKSLILCTGSQGEARAALSRLASGKHQYLKIEEGDSVIFSSRMIPGNERDILNLQNTLTRLGANIINPTGQDLHVSGHPCRDELQDMYEWVRPALAIPVHGEARHLKAHAACARKWGVPQAAEIENGDIVQIVPPRDPNKGMVIDRVKSGRLYLDGRILITGEDHALATRRKLAECGAILISLPLDAAHRLCGDIDITLIGVPENDDFYESLHDAVESVIPSNGKLTPARAEKAIRSQIVRVCKTTWGKRPAVEVHFTICH